MALSWWTVQRQSWLSRNLFQNTQPQLPSHTFVEFLPSLLAPHKSFCCMNLAAARISGRRNRRSRKLVGKGKVLALLSEVLPSMGIEGGPMWKIWGKRKGGRGTSCRQTKKMFLLFTIFLLPNASPVKQQWSSLRGFLKKTLNQLHTDFCPFQSLLSCPARVS